MLLNLWFVINNPVIIIVLVIGILILKAVIAAGSTLLIGQSLRTSVLAGLALCNIGEFAFVLSVPGKEYGFFTETSDQFFLAVAVITMALTPFIIAAGPQVADRVCRLPFGNRLKTGCIPRNTGKNGKPQLADHLIILGDGPDGRHLAKVARIGNLPYIIFHINPDTVDNNRRRVNRYSLAMPRVNPFFPTPCRTTQILVVAIDNPFRPGQLLVWPGR